MEITANDDVVVTAGAGDNLLGLLMHQPRSILAIHPSPDAIAIFGDSILYVNLDECTSCTACYQPDVCPVGAIYSEEHVPDGSAKARYNSNDPNKGHDHTFFIQLSRDGFAD